MTSELISLHDEVATHVTAGAASLRQRNLYRTLDDEHPAHRGTVIDKNLRVGFGLHGVFGQPNGDKRVAFVVGLARSDRGIVEKDFDR